MTQANWYIPIGTYKDQQIYYDLMRNEVYLEKDYSHLVKLTAQEHAEITIGLTSLEALIKEVKQNARED